MDSIVGGKDMNLPGWLQGWIEAIGGRDYLAANLWLPALAVLLVQGLNGVCAYFRGRCSALGGEGLAKALRDALYRRLVRAPYAWHKASSTGDLVQRCTSDVETVPPEGLQGWCRKSSGGSRRSAATAVSSGRLSFVSFAP